MSDEAGPSGCVVDAFAKKRTVSVSTVENGLQKMTRLLTPLRGSGSTDLQVIMSVLRR